MCRPPIDHSTSVRPATAIFKTFPMLAPMAPALGFFIFSSVWVALSVLSIPTAAADGQGGEHCAPVLCGNVSVGFPFGVVPEDAAVQTDCGRIEFQVRCRNSIPYLGFYQTEYNLQILSIFYDNASLLIADASKGSGGCHIPATNTTSGLGRPFSVSPVNQNLIFYNCTEPVVSPREGLVETICSGELRLSSYSYARVAAGSSDELRLSSYFLDGCVAAVVPVLGWSANKTNASNYEELIRDGFLVTWPPSDQRKKQNIKLIFIVALSAPASLILTCLVWLMYRKKEKHILLNQKYIANVSNIEKILKGYDSLIPKRYKYSELKKITRSFKDKLGEGGYGTVFKGTLEDGREVAVKLLKQSKGNGEEFLNEVVSIRRTSHVNIVNLLGFCLHGSKRALIYEYMVNDSLEKYIYSEETKRAIGWEKLREIAIGIARGLEYLHRGCNTRIIHFDIKPHNILLDEDFCPKIADFGLAKLCHLKDSALSMAEARGTIGFIAPEVFSRGFGVVSTKSDVYSYGMMLLEMVGGRTNVKESIENSSEAYFPNWVYDRLVNDLQSHEVTCEVDDIARQMTLVGLWCIQTAPGNRPSMSRVIEMLEKNINELEMPPKPLLSCPSELSYFSS